MSIITPEHPPHAPHVPPSGHIVSAHNAALLIDFDNVTMGIRSDLQHQLRRLVSSEVIRAKVSVQRAYADWRRYPQYIVPLSEASIDLIFAPAFGSNKKNATDIRLAIDALELVFTRPEIGTFILLSGDSDFSALVLKLKEYGKYVIGVGIRESASDLLVQNCDEYYSYSELTGLAKQVEVDSLPRDPWELVVEAVLRMVKTGDVMRSDRLKQVMQEMDPHFDEKDAGFNKFSKFVQEAARRGLIEVVKMENGQFEVRVGPDANVPVLSEQLGQEVQTATPERRQRFKGSAEKSAIGRTGMVLAEAFALLKDTLRDLGAIDTESSDADQVRERMRGLASDSGDPIFEPGRFQRLLRQAHDASIIELVKTSDDVYLLKLAPDQVDDAEDSTSDKPGRRERAPRARTTKTETVVDVRTARAVAVPDVAEVATTASAPDTPDEAESEKKGSKRKTTKKKATKKKAARKPETQTTTSAAKTGTEKPSAQQAAETVEGGDRNAVSIEKDVAPEKPESKLTPTPPVKPATGKAGTDEAPERRRNPRYRAGSRGVRQPAVAPPNPPDATAREESAFRPPAPGVQSSGRRSVLARSGSRKPRVKHGDEATTEVRPTVAEQEVMPPRQEVTPPKQEVNPPKQEVTPPQKEPTREPESAMTPPSAAPKPSATPPAKPEVPAEQEEGGGLLKRMSAALHRAVLGDTDE